MSFAEHLLDAYDALEKKTATSLTGLKGLSQFMKHTSDVFKKCSGDAQAVCSKYKSKEIKILEGTVYAAVVAIVSEVESAVIAPFGTLTSEFEKSSKEIETFVKEREQSRKKLIADSTHMQKEWEATMNTLRKAKDAYFKFAKEAASAQAASEKAQDKNAAVAKQKADAAMEKARGADDGYGSLLVRTNDMQRAYYTQTQPEMLSNYQQWEDERIQFVKSQLVALADHIISLEMPVKWDQLTSSFKGCAEAIDSKADLDSYARSIGNNTPIPNDMPYEAAPVGPSNGGPESLSSNGSSRSSPAPAASSAPASSSSSSSMKSGGISPAPVKAAPVPAATQPAASSGGASNDADSEEGVRHRALFDYESQNDGEMSLKEGEIVMITEKDPSGWWYATADGGREGFVPSSYVEPV